MKKGGLGLVRYGEVSEGGHKGHRHKVGKGKEDGSSSSQTAGHETTWQGTTQ